MSFHLFYFPFFSFSFSLFIMFPSFALLFHFFLFSFVISYTLTFSYPELIVRVRTERWKGKIRRREEGRKMIRKNRPGSRRRHKEEWMNICVLHYSLLSRHKFRFKQRRINSYLFVIPGSNSGQIADSFLFFCYNKIALRIFHNPCSKKVQKFLAESRTHITSTLANCIGLSPHTYVWGGDR
jgi:hypothetical protein